MSDSTEAAPAAGRTPSAWGRILEQERHRRLREFPTKSAWAKHLGIDHATYSKYLYGPRKPTSTRAVTLANSSAMPPERREEFFRVLGYDVALAAITAPTVHEGPGATR